jgi:hypothetical protein
MKTTKAVLAALACLLCLGGLAGSRGARAAGATSTYSTSFMTISNLAFYSASDTVFPQYAGIVEVLFAQPIDWAQPSSCDTGAVAIRSTDTPLISAVQAALATGRPVQLFVDTRTVDGLVCYLRAIEY